MNKMKGIAKLLGVQIGERFDIKGSHNNPYVLSLDGLIDINNNIHCSLLGDLLWGKGEIVKKFIPEDGEECYYVDATGHRYTIKFDHSTAEVKACFVSFGNCFKTKEEITPEIRQAIVDKIKKTLDGDIK